MLKKYFFEIDPSQVQHASDEADIKNAAQNQENSDLYKNFVTISKSIKIDK
jgi:hypothetical protein